MRDRDEKKRPLPDEPLPGKADGAVDLPQPGSDAGFTPDGAGVAPDGGDAKGSKTGGSKDAKTGGFIEASKPPTTSDSVDYRRLFRWSWAVVRTARGPFLAATGLALLTQTLTQYGQQLLSSIMTMLGRSDAGAKEGANFLDAIVPQDLPTAAVLFVVVLFLGIGLDLGKRLLEVLSDNLMSSRLQIWLHDKLLKLGPDYHRAHDVGGTSVVVTQYATGAQLLFADLVSYPLLRGIGMLTALAFLVGNLQMLGDTPPALTLVLIGTLLLLPLGTWFLSHKVRQAYVGVRDRQKEVSEEVLNSLSQPAEVQVLGAEQQRSTSFARALRRLVKERLRAAFRLESVQQFQKSVPNILQAVYLAYGVYVAVSTGDTSAAGPILAIYLFVPQVVEPLQDIMQFYVGLQTSWAQVADVVDILEAEEQILDRDDAQDAPTGMLPLTLAEVVFRYAPALPPVLNGVTHTFEPASVNALVARSGGGKSTIFHLLTRLYDPQQGTVRFGDQDIRNLHIRSYRRRVAKVSQFPLFIFDSIRENFRLADAEASDEEMRRACERTGLWPILEHIAGPKRDPLDYVLPRSQDQGLSGGERRWLAVTRALLTEPAVLLLDEPTTGIDALGREVLIRLVRDLGSRMTVIVVDHNVEEFIAEVADRVCVLEDGLFTQVGSPAELADAPGLFRSLLLHGEESPEPSAEDDLPLDGPGDAPREFPGAGDAKKGGK